MRCAYHPDSDAVGECINCGKPVCSECRTTLLEKTYCQSCAKQLLAPEPATPTVPAARSGSLTAGAVLSIVAGGITVITGLAAIRHRGLLGVILLALGAVAILGGNYALQRKRYGWALAGAICALIPVWFLGIPAIVLIVQSKKQFT